MPVRPKYEQFSEWAKENLGFNPSDRAIQNWMQANVSSARSQFQQHAIASRLQQFVENNQATDKRKSINIMGAEIQPYVKSYPSILSKLYRLNILQNNRFPAPPRRGG